VPRTVLRFAHVCLALSAVVFASHVFHAITLHRSRAMAVVAAVLTLGACACFRLPREARVKAALTLASVLAAVYGFELVLDVRKPGAATAAWLAGRAWDGRSRGEVVEDLRAEGKDAWPCVRPSLILHRWPRGLPLGGADAIPLGGVAGVPTVFCNEGGSWTVYDADEHGFNNPKGLWSAGTEIALVGDSFAQGACVPPEGNIAAALRRRHPATLDLGMAGNGPLIELATLVEYLTVRQPKTVLWLYFSNDMSDLALEAKSPALRRYVDEDGFRVGLDALQPAVDEALRTKMIAGMLESESLRWPRALSAVGLTQRRAPVWVQDLATQHKSSSFAALLRLDHLLALAPAGEEAPPARPDFALFEKILRKAAALTASWGGTLRFVYLPDYMPVHPNRAGVLAAARAAGVPILDLHPMFMARTDMARLRYYPEAHFNEAGYALVAEAIEDALAKDR
jgi:lysophospholipase L1-like esterase